MRYRVLAIAAVWFTAALLAGATGVISKLQPPLPQVVLFGLTAALLFAFWKATDFRDWVLGLPLRALALFHVTRFVGIYFLVLQARGQLPDAFAAPAGLGDIAVAVTAPIIAFISESSPAGRRAYTIWNAVGLADILFVVCTAARLALLGPDSMRALTVLPLSLLPTFLVPIIIASHIVIFVKLRRSDL